VPLYKMTPITCQIQSTSMLSHLLLMRDVVMSLTGLLQLVCGCLYETHTKCISYRKFVVNLMKVQLGLLGPLLETMN